MDSPLSRRSAMRRHVEFAEPMSYMKTSTSTTTTSPLSLASPRTIMKSTLTSSEKVHRDSSPLFGSGSRNASPPSLLSRIRKRISLMSPPVRTSHSPKFTEEELDALTSNLPYNTNYTYAYSKIYDPSLPDHWEVPNLGPVSVRMPTSHYSAASLSRQTWNIVTYPVVKLMQFILFLLVLLRDTFLLTIVTTWDHMLHFIYQTSSSTRTWFHDTFNPSSATFYECICSICVFFKTFVTTALFYLYTSARFLVSLMNPSTFLSSRLADFQPATEEDYSFSVARVARDNSIPEKRRISARPSLSPPREFIRRMQRNRQQDADDSSETASTSSVQLRRSQRRASPARSVTPVRNLRRRVTETPRNAVFDEMDNTFYNSRLRPRNQPSSFQPVSFADVRNQRSTQSAAMESSETRNVFEQFFSASQDWTSKALLYVLYCFTIPFFAAKQMGVYAYQRTKNFATGTGTEGWNDEDFDRVVIQEDTAEDVEEGGLRLLYSKLCSVYLFFGRLVEDMINTTFTTAIAAAKGVYENGSKRRFWWLLPFILLLLIFASSKTGDLDIGERLAPITNLASESFHAAAQKSHAQVNSWVKDAVGSVKTLAEGAKEKMRDAAFSIENGPTEEEDGVLDFFGVFWDGAANSVTKVRDAVVGCFKAICNGFLRIFGFIFKTFGNTFQALTGRASKITQGTYYYVSQGSNNIWNGATGGFGKVFSTGSHAITDGVFYPICRGVSKGFRSFGSFIVDIVFEIYSFLQRAWKLMVGSGGSFYDAFTTLFLQMVGTVLKTVYFIYETTIDIINLILLLIVRSGERLWDGTSKFGHYVIERVYTFFSFIWSAVPAKESAVGWVPLVAKGINSSAHSIISYIHLPEFFTKTTSEHQKASPPIPTPIVEFPAHQIPSQPMPTFEMKVDHSAIVADVMDKVRIEMETKMKAEMEAKMHGMEESYLLLMKKTIDQNYNVKLDSSELEAIVRNMIQKYDADKTGKVDYALESSGASVISTRCSETYNTQSRLEKIWNIPLWYSYYGPRTVIQRNSKTLFPGECWSFKNDRGYLTIDLSHEINISSVSYEHIGPEVAPDGERSSAPKNFKIWAYKDADDISTRFLIGDFTYRLDAAPLQYFEAQAYPTYPVKILEMEVTSNYGAVYTCLYRLRVHGKRYSA